MNDTTPRGEVISRAYADWREALADAEEAHQLARQAATDKLQATLTEAGEDFVLLGATA